MFAGDGFECVVAFVVVSVTSVLPLTVVFTLAFARLVPVHWLCILLYVPVIMSRLYLNCTTIAEDYYSLTTFG